MMGKPGRGFSETWGCFQIMQVTLPGWRRQRGGDRKSLPVPKLRLQFTKSLVFWTHWVCEVRHLLTRNFLQQAVYRHPHP